MHVLFLAPDTHLYNHAFLRALRGLGARVSAIGPAPKDRLSRAAAALLDGYEGCAALLDVAALLACAQRLAKAAPFDLIETIDEPLVEPAAALRAALGAPGLDVETARRCRDKVAMKVFLREHGVPCAQTDAATNAAELREVAARIGFPVIVKPVAGFNALGTYRLDDLAALDALVEREPKLFGTGDRVAVEEFVEGHEGFYDTVIGPDGLVRHDFVGHYHPGCLEANRTRAVAPQIAITNRIDGDGYTELRAMGQQVATALGLRSCATHMEWFFGPRGLKFSEIGARPAGEKIWDMYRVGNDLDIYREWALAVTERPSDAKPSRRLAVGSVQIRPNRDGKIVVHTGVTEALRDVGSMVYELELPRAGTATKGLDRGWLCNTWFRLQHPDYDEVCRAMTLLGERVKTVAR
ncbi:MAG: ATPase [Planctomycetota bacterium]